MVREETRTFNFPSVLIDQNTTNNIDNNSNKQPDRINKLKISSKSTYYINKEANKSTSKLILNIKVQ